MTGLNQLCRLCAEIRPREKMSEINNSTLNIEQKLVDCCRWTHFKELNADANLPQHICIVCIEKLEQCWLFAESVASAQYKLIEFINNSKLSPFDESVRKFGGDTMSAAISTETPVEIDVYVKIVDNQQIKTENSETNPIEYQPTECVEKAAISKKSTKNIKRDRNKFVVENAGDQCTNDEKSFESSNNVGNFPRQLKLDDRNDDGTVNSDAIQRLGLVNWMVVLQHQCCICYVCFCSNYELKAHFTSEHANNDLRYMCSMCSKSTDQRSYHRRSLLHKHIMRKHLPHLKYW